MQKNILVLLFLFLLSVTLTQAQTDNSSTLLRMEHDGVERDAYIYEPSSESNAAIIALHSFYSSARAMEALTGLNEIAEERGWLVIYPQAIYPYWDDGRVDANLPPNNGTVDDVGYLSALVDTVRENYGIEDVYLTGLGQGGTMALRAACESPEQFAGVAIVNALMWRYQVSNCDKHENTNVPNMLFITGALDHIYWAEGRQIVLQNGQGWVVMSQDETLDYWSTRLECADPIENTVRRSTLATYEDCNNGTSIASVTVLGGGNNWHRVGEGRINQTDIDASSLIAAFFSNDENWAEQTTQEEITTENARTYVLYVPSSYDASTPTPVVVALHGRGANTFSQASSSRFDLVAEEHGFIVVYPQAFDVNFNIPGLADAVWNYNLGNSLGAQYDWNDDIFLDQMLDELALDLNIDMSRLYVTGLSNGGYMTNRLACTRGDRYAAFAAVAATAPFGINELCEDDIHAPIMFYHGTEDTISPWAGAPATHPLTGQSIFLLAPMSNTLAFWLNQNGCESAYEQTEVESTDPDSNVLFVRYVNCPNDSAVEIYAVVGGGHVWHGVNDFESSFLGEVNMDVNASEAIWAFFSGYSLDGYDEARAVEFDLGEAVLFESPASAEVTPEATEASE